MRIRKLLKDWHVVPVGLIVPADMPVAFEDDNAIVVYDKGYGTAYAVEERDKNAVMTAKPIRPPLPTVMGSTICGRTYDDQTSKVLTLNSAGRWVGVSQDFATREWRPEFIAEWEPVEIHKVSEDSEDSEDSDEEEVEDAAEVEEIDAPVRESFYNLRLPRRFTKWWLDQSPRDGVVVAQESERYLWLSMTREAIVHLKNSAVQINHAESVETNFRSAAVRVLDTLYRDYRYLLRA